MNLKPILFAAFLAAGTMTTTAQTKPTTAVTSEMNTIVSNLKKNVEAYQKADKESSQAIMESIHTDMKAALHAAKKNTSAMEPMTDVERNKVMEQYMKVEQAYFSVVRNQKAVEGEDQKTAVISKIIEFMSLLK